MNTTTRTITPAASTSRNARSLKDTRNGAIGDLSAAETFLERSRLEAIARRFFLAAMLDGSFCHWALFVFTPLVGALALAASIQPRVSEPRAFRLRPQRILAMRRQ